MSLLLGTESRALMPVAHADFSSTSVVPPNSQGGGWNWANTQVSLQKVAVWACVNLTATICEVMPLDVFNGTGPDKRQKSMPSWLGDLGGDGYGLHDWLWQAVFSAMLRGNPIGRVLERDPRTGQERQIALANPDTVRADPDADEPGGVRWTFAGRYVPAGQVWHRRVFPAPGFVLGQSPIQIHAATLGLALDSMQFGRRWFADGAHPSALLTSDEDLDPDSASEAKRRFIAALRGNREPLVLGNGWKYQQIQIAPEESQFLETQGYTSAECCRIFGPAYAEIFGYETGGSLTYANIEQRSLDLLTYAVDPWLVRLERWLSQLLPGGQNVKFNRKALVRTDLLTRYKAHEIALKNQFAVVNEVRAAEDEPPVPWGDKPTPVAKSMPPAPAAQQDPMSDGATGGPDA